MFFAKKIFSPPDVALSLIAFRFVSAWRCCVRKYLLVKRFYSADIASASSVHNNLNINHFVFKQAAATKTCWEVFHPPHAGEKLWLSTLGIRIIVIITMCTVLETKPLE